MIDYLMTLAHPVDCPNCGVALAMNPKAIGMGAGSWEIQCVQCPSILFGGLSGYDPRTAPAYQRLSHLRNEFVDSGDLHSGELEVLALAQQYDSVLKRTRCECGASFSIAAKPRCPDCKAVVFQTFFHYVFRPKPRVVG
jgi:hypothetical protein